MRVNGNGSLRAANRVNTGENRCALIWTQVCNTVVLAACKGITEEEM